MNIPPAKTLPIDTNPGFQMKRMNFKLSSLFAVRQDKDMRAFLSVFRLHFPAYKYKYAFLFVLICITSATTGLAAWLIKHVVNDFFVNKSGDMLIPLFLTIMALFIAKGLTTYWQTLLSARISNSIIARTQERIFAHILAQRLRFFERHSSDDLLVRISSGASAFGAILNQVILNGARDALTVIVLLFVMIWQDYTLTLVCFLVAPPVFWGLTRLLKRIKTLVGQEMRSAAELNKHVREAIQGAKVIKSYNLEPVVSAQAEEMIGIIRDRSNRVSALQAAPLAIIDTAGGAGIGLTLLYAGYQSVYNGYSPGDFMSFITSLLLAMDPLRRLSQLRVSLKTSLVGVRLVQDLLDDNDPDHEKSLNIKPRFDHAPDGGLPISMKNVSFSYEEGGKRVLQDLSLDIKPGETVALAGPSGTGKSTVFSLLLRFHRHQSGQILVGGQPIETIPTAELRNLIAYVGQSNFVFSGTIRNNLTLGRLDIPHEKIEEACETVGLRDHILSLPLGYDTNVGELGSLISGGQAQRLNVARAIIKDAPILLFDEVTSALDADNEELIRAYMQRQAGKKTILVIAHRISTIRQVDRIALIGEGKVQAFGSHAELMHGNDYYERVAGLQLIS